MKLLDVVTSPWAIAPNKLIEIRNIYLTHLRGDKIDIKGIEARIGKPLNNETHDIDVINGVAIISAYGVMAKRINIFMLISGGVSTEILQNQIKQAIHDDDVKSIILDIDSPGGTVNGTFETAELVFNARSEKPIVAFANGMADSAAYAIASAASKIYMSSVATEVGSIGVVATHVDVSEHEKRDGIKTTEITAGKFKRTASQYEPLSKEGLADIQSQVDILYTVFVEKVAQFRAVSVQTVLDDMADGRVFIGQQAIDANLVDGIATIDSLIDQLSNGIEPQKLTGVLASNEAYKIINHLETDLEEISMADKKITKGFILDNHPEIAEAFRNEGRDGFNLDEIKKQSATDERNRIKSVEDQLISGHEDLINELKFDGKTTGPEAAVQILANEKKTRGNIAQQLIDDAPTPVPAAEIPKSKPAIDKDLPIDEQCKIAWDTDPKLRSEFGDFDSFVAYSVANDGGLVRVMGGSK